MEPVTGYSTEQILKIIGAVYLLRFTQSRKEMPRCMPAAFFYALLNRPLYLIDYIAHHKYKIFWRIYALQNQ